MIEINVIGKIVNARPFDRDAGFPAFADGFEIGRRSKKLRVAVHARFRRGHSGARGAFNGSMTITAINTIIADVMLMAELNGLGFDDVRLIPVRRARNTDKDHVNRKCGNSTRSHERYARYRVRALLKNLRHLFGFDVRSSSETTERMNRSSLYDPSYAAHESVIRCERATTNDIDRPVLKGFYALAGTLSFALAHSFHYKNNKKMERARKNRIFVVRNQ